MDLEETNNPDFLDRLTAGVGSEKMKKAMNAYLLGMSVYQIGRQVWFRVKNEVTYTVSVASDDELYSEVQDWLSDKLKPKHRRSLDAWKGKRQSRSYLADDDEAKKPVVHFSFNGERAHPLIIDGHKVWVSIESKSALAGSQITAGVVMTAPEKIVFTCRSLDAMNAVTSMMEHVSSFEENQKPRLVIADRWGGWNRRSDLPSRNLDTVYLNDGLTEEIVEDLESFFSSEHTYADLGIPWHRGYVLYGPPGTGKTSLARAVATHFDMDTYYIPLSDVEADTNLLSLISGVPARSLLLLEDIDVVKAATSRDDQGKGVSLSALLNSLDGIATPNGLVTVMTTNHLEEIDGALIRPGRVDKKIEIGYLSDGQVSQIMKSAMGEVRAFPSVAGAMLTPADLIESFKGVMNDGPDAVYAAALEFTSSRGKVKVDE